MEIPDYITENKILVGFVVLTLAVVTVSGVMFMGGQDSPVDGSPEDSPEDSAVDGSPEDSTSNDYQPLEYDNVQKAEGYSVYGEVSVESYEGDIVYNPLDSINGNSDMELKVYPQFGDSPVKTLGSSRIIDRNGEKYLAYSFEENPAFQVEEGQKLSIESSGYFDEDRQQRDKETSLNKWIIGENCNCLMIFNLEEVDTSDFKAQDFRLEGTIESDSRFFVPDEDVKSQRVVVSSQGDYLGEFELDGFGEEEDFSVVLEDVKKPVQPYSFQYKPVNGSIAEAQFETGLFNSIETIERFGSFSASSSDKMYSLTVELENVSVVE